VAVRVIWRVRRLGGGSSNRPSRQDSSVCMIDLQYRLNASAGDLRRWASRRWEKVESAQLRSLDVDFFPRLYFVFTFT
jgi:hypothetical protein